jgi:hypothetical protein
MEKYGFVYIWRDRKHKRFYIGSHWGLETDGYICSSRWMRKAYKRRPEDFKRRVVSRIYLDREALLIEEERWLAMIHPEEVKKRYYNLKFGSQKRWWGDAEKVLSIGEKISRAKKKSFSDHPEMAAEHSRKMVQHYMNKPESRESARERTGIQFSVPSARERASEKTLRYFEEHPEAREGARLKAARKLTREDAANIRQDKRSRAEIAKDYGISVRYVGKVISGDSWGDHGSAS